MRWIVVPATCFAFSLGLLGCGRQSDEDRLKALVPNAQATIPISGQVLVDGQPMKNLWVKLHHVSPQPNSPEPTAQTDADGKFKITSYIGGDGAPQGEYKVTVEWLTFKQFGSQWVGPNKLLGPSGDPKTTEYSVKVADQPVVLPTYEEKANPDLAKLKPVKNSLTKEKHAP